MAFVIVIRLTCVFSWVYVCAALHINPCLISLFIDCVVNGAFEGGLRG